MEKLHATMNCVGRRQRIVQIRPASPAANHATLPRIRDYVICQANADSILISNNYTLTAQMNPM